MRASLQQNSGDNHSPSDSSLMERLGKGDMSALEEIYMRYSSMVKAAVYRVSPKVLSADVEELTQDIFITLVKSAPQFDGEKRLKPWLYGIAVNKAADNKRSNWLHCNLLKKHSLNQAVVCPSQVESVDEKMDLREQLERAFETLPKEQHDVMVLHAIENFKGHEIAEILGIEINTVWTRLHRARKRLCEKLREVKTGYV